MIEDKILYGRELIPVNLPKEVFIAQPEGGAEKSEPIHDIKAGLKEAIDNPLGLPTLNELTKPGMKVTIAFDDPTVGQANTDVWKYGINLALEEVFKAGVKKKNIDLVCANALHRKFTHLELAQIIGEDLVSDFGQQLYCHDAEDKDNLVNLGRTESGYQVDLNRCVTEADLVVYVNTYLARAFNGGWKSICVGLSSSRSIRQHHHPDIMSMSVDRNPMHDILNEMGDLVDKKLGRDRIFKIETLQKNYFQVAKFWAGSIACRNEKTLYPPKKLG
jgi:nickel-dependent lactate racemase